MHGEGGVLLLPLRAFLCGDEACSLQSRSHVLNHSGVAGSRLRNAFTSQLVTSDTPTVGNEAEIREVVDRETRAWDTQDVELLLSVFHPDMVWPWPSTYTSVDPVDWTLVLGRFDATRWRSVFDDLFDAYDLVHNRRFVVKIEVSAEGDGAIAVIDTDTLWRERSTGEESNHWLGRTCKVYAFVADGWKMTMQTGALRYE